MHQIDVLAVGEKTCGEAIAFRMGDLGSNDPSKQFVVLIDGGFKSNGQEIVNHIRSHYGTNRVDLVVSTHSDSDHIGGLPTVLEEMEVGRLWMHQPWEHSSDVLAARQDDFSTVLFKEHLRKSLQATSDVSAAADAAGLTVFEPFAGHQLQTSYGSITVLGPSIEYYESLLGKIDLSGYSQRSAGNSLAAALSKLAGSIAHIAEDHNIETLSNFGTTSNTNNSSIILLFELVDGKKFLFSGDAGIQALEQAAEVYRSLGHLPGELSFMQVPHHGSRKNVGPKVLDMFLGGHLPEGSPERGGAGVSVGITCDNHGHPYKVVTNAFKRRGYPVNQTRGKGVMWGVDRSNWNPVNPLPMYSMVEADD